MVLATDMKQHFTILSHFSTVHRLGGTSSVTPSLGNDSRRRWVGAEGVAAGSWAIAFAVVVVS